MSTGNGPALTKLPEGCVMKMDPAEAIRHATQVRAIPPLRADLARLMADLDVKDDAGPLFRCARR